MYTCIYAVSVGGERDREANTTTCCNAALLGQGGGPQGAQESFAFRVNHKIGQHTCRGGSKSPRPDSDKNL